MRYMYMLLLLYGHGHVRGACVGKSATRPWMEERAQLVAHAGASNALDVDQPAAPAPTQCARCRWTRRLSLALAGIALVSSLLTTNAMQQGGARTRAPNILLFEADQARPDAHSAELTPNLEAIHVEGVRFSRAYSSTPICTPARLALLTGRSTMRHGMRAYREHVPAHRTSHLELISTMAAHGYHTAVVGKNHFGLDQGHRFNSHGFAEMHLHEGLLAYDPLSPNFVRLDDYGEWFNRSCPGCDPLATHRGYSATWRNAATGSTPYNSIEGFVYPHPEELHPTHWTADMAIQSIDRWLSLRRTVQQQALFLKVSFHRPHSPYDPPDRIFRQVLARVEELATPATGDWDAQYASGGNCTAAEFSYCGSSCGYQAYCGRLQTEDARRTRAFYYASLAFVDEQAGRVLSRMRNAESEWHNTFVLYLSDHGDALGDHNLWRKGYPYEQVASVPFYMRWPDSWDGEMAILRGTVLAHLVELRDVFPTLADVAGISLEGSVEARPDGLSLLPLLRADTPTQWRDVLMLELSQCNFNDMNWVALTDGRVKYIRHINHVSEQLFDLVSDPYEEHDLAQANASTVAAWRARLASEFVREQRDLKWISPDGSLAEARSCAAYESLVACDTTRRVGHVEVGATPQHTISPDLFSMFIETEINYGGEGGLYAELIRNGDFEALGRGCLDNCPLKPPWKLQPMVATDGRDAHEPPADEGDFRPWSAFGGARPHVDSTTAPFRSNPYSLRIDCDHAECGVRNPGYWGIGVRPGCAALNLSLFIRSLSSSPLRIAARLVHGDSILTEAAIVQDGTSGATVDGWNHYRAWLQPRTNETKAASLEIVLLETDQPCTFWLDSVSLFPSDAVGGIFRRDIFDKLQALNPGFIRLPGGNYLEGFGPHSRWDWRKTLGRTAARPGHYNAAWGYWVRDGLGLFEMLRLCELLLAPCQLSVFTGYSIKVPYIPLNESDVFAQDALDLLEFANEAPGISAFASLRSDMGHPSPFYLSRLEVGNEERVQDEYASHYVLISQRLWARHPNLTIVASGRWQSADDVEGSPCLMGARCDVWDEHL